jgi:hypothetical protein
VQEKKVTEDNVTNNTKILKFFIINKFNVPS